MPTMTSVSTFPEIVTTPGRMDQNRARGRRLVVVGVLGVLGVLGGVGATVVAGSGHLAIVVAFSALLLPGVLGKWRARTSQTLVESI